MRYLFYIFIVLPLISKAQGDWQLKKEKNDIRVFMRSIDGSPFKEIKVDMTIKTSLNVFNKFISDVKNHKEWIYGNRQLYLLEKISEDLLIYYTEFDLPWPASDRDINTRLQVITDSIPGTTFVISEAIPGYSPINEGLVRITSSRAFWKVTKVNEMTIKIEYVIRLDPAGSLPAWLVNMTATTGPYNSFSNLKNMLEKKKAGD